MLSWYDLKISKRYIYDQSFGGVTQKISLPRPSEVLSHFGWKFKTSASRNFKFGENLDYYEYFNWKKFGVNISKHFWVIQIWLILLLKLRPTYEWSALKGVAGLFFELHPQNFDQEYIF